jgi:hypothetical protein
VQHGSHRGGAQTHGSHACLELDYPMVERAERGAVVGVGGGGGGGGGSWRVGSRGGVSSVDVPPGTIVIST